MKTIYLRGTSKEIQHLIYLFNNDLYVVTHPSCGAEAHELIAEHLGIQYDGLFTTELYKQNTVKFIKNWLKALGYKVSKLTMVEASKLVEVHFYNKEYNNETTI